ncbi:MAG: hypothetical protein K0S61_693 [Anaerocolumna sp.]|jgi:hypothetical protein|nr:hypothetical protein [Anaerocolumna sp.]
MVKEYRFKLGPINGLNLAIDESLLKPSETPSSMNVEIDTGIFKTSLGITKYVATSLNGLDSIMTYYKDKVGYILVGASNKLYRLNGSTFTEIASGFSSSSFDSVNNNVNSEDVIVITNTSGSDNVKVYNGTTVRDLKRNGAASADASDNKAPHGKFIELHYERLWLADDNNLYISKDFDIDDFTTPTDENEVNMHGAEIVAYSNDGSKIIGLKVIFDDVVIFKEKSIFKIYGTNPTVYQKVQIFSSNGAIADKSIVATSKGAFFINKDGIYVYDGTNVNLISQKITPIFRRINVDAITKAVAYYWNDKYILAIPVDGSTENNLIIEYDLSTKEFITRTGFSVRSFADLGDKLLFTSNNYIYQYNTGTTIDGAVINANWETGLSDFNMPNAVKEVSLIYFTGKGTGQVKISCISEKKTKFKIVDLTSSNKVYRLNINNKGRLIKFKIENVSGSPIEINGFNAVYELDED